jgi:hypothetical protein
MILDDFNCGACGTEVFYHNVKSCNCDRNASHQAKQMSRVEAKPMPGSNGAVVAFRLPRVGLLKFVHSGFIIQGRHMIQWR